MALEGYTVKHVDRSEIKDLIEAWHYSQSINGLMSSHCFGLYDPEGVLVGGMIYGGLGMANAWKKYADSPEEVLELRRLGPWDAGDDLPLWDRTPHTSTGRLLVDN